MNAVYILIMNKYGQKKALDLGQFVSSNLNTDIFLVLYVQLEIKR
jgi:hypothetical protein